MTYRVQTLINADWHFTMGIHSTAEPAIEICNTIGDCGFWSRVISVQAGVMQVVFERRI